MELSGRQLFISDVKTKAVHVSSLHFHLFSFSGRGINFRSNSVITDYEGLSIFVRNNRERSCDTLGPKRGDKFVRYIRIRLYIWTSVKFMAACYRRILLCHVLNLNLEKKFRSIWNWKDSHKLILSGLCRPREYSQKEDSGWISADLNPYWLVTILFRNLYHYLFFIYWLLTKTTLYLLRLKPFATNWDIFSVATIINQNQIPN